MSQTVFGAAGVVSILNRAFTNTSPGTLIFNNQIAAAGNTRESQVQFAAQFGNNFASLVNDSEALTDTIITNMGLAGVEAEFLTALRAEVVALFESVPASIRGVVVLLLSEVLSSVEGATGELALMSPVAAAWNNEIVKSFEYSSNNPNAGDPLAIPADTTAPVVTAPAAPFAYAENQAADAVVATVAATDAVGVTSFEITSGNDAGFFAIDAEGKITLSEAGLASTANDADDTGATAANAFTLKVKAVDAAGNKSEAVEVKLEVKDVDDAAPTLTSAVIVGTTATLTFNEDLQGTVSVADFKVKIAGGSGDVTINKAEIKGKSVVLTLAAAPSTGQSYTVDYTGTGLTDKAATPNALAPITAAPLVTDTTAPTFAAGQTVSYQEGFADDAADVLGTVEATDATGVSTFTIESGNTGNFFAISNEGKLTLTAAGLAGAANDFETLPNSFTLGIKATDGAGNFTTQNVTVTVTNNTADDAAAPLELALTNQTDAKAGESGDDTFIGDNASVQAADVIDGNGGKDTARLTFAPAAATTYILTSREVETFKLQNATTANKVTFNAINVTELENLTNNNSTFDLAVTNVGANAVIGVVGGVTAPAAAADFEVSYQTGKNTGTAKINLEAARLDELSLTDGFSAYEITTTGTGSSTIRDFTAASAGANLANLRTITFKGDKQLTITDELEGVTTFTATDNSGGVRVVIDDAAGANVTFAGGSGNDRVDVQAVNLTSGDKLDGGTGTDTLRISEAAGGASTLLTLANAANVKGFEVLEVRAATTTYDIDNIIANNALTGLTLAGGTGATDAYTVNNINAGALGNIKLELTDENDTVTLTAKGFTNGGTSDTATIELNNSTGVVGAPVDGNGIDVATLTFVGLDNLTIKSTSDGTADASEQNSIATLVAADLEKLTITGDNAISITTDASTTGLTEVDASGLVNSSSAIGATINLSADVTGGGALLIGSAQDDVLIGTGNGSTSGDTFRAGKGSDTMTVDTGATAQRDAFVYTATALGAGDLSANDVDTINGFQGAMGGLAATSDVVVLDAAVLNTLKVAGTVLGTSGADVTLNAGLSATTNIATVAVGADLEVRFDLNGNGIYDQSTDFAIKLTGHANNAVVYNATNKLLYVAQQATAGDDVLTGTDAADTLNGLAGNDTISGLAGSDTITGGAGNDSLTGGADNDTFNVDAGSDTITDLATGDILVVSAGATAAATTAAFVATAATSNAGTATLTAAAAGGNISVALATGANGFTLAGAAGADTLVGGAAADSITGGAGNDTITGGAGNDTINAGIGTDTITDAGNGADTITHDSAASTVAIAVTGTGVVTLTASQAGATATSAVGINTTVNAGASTAAVTLLGNTGADTLTGGAVADTITGGDGADSLVGGAGADSLVGGAGADTLVGGNGADNLTGGADADTFDFTGADATIDTITDWGVGADVLTGALSAGGQLNVTISDASATAFTAAAIAAVSGVVSVTGGLANDTITGGAGADTINGGAGADTINGGAGNDSITAGEGADTVTIGAGQDVVILTEAAPAADTLVWATAFAAGNVNAATVTDFAFGAGADLIDINIAVLNGTIDIAAGTGATNTLAALAPVAVTSNGTATANDVIFTFNGAGDLLAAGTTVANAVANAVTALTSGTDFSSANIATGDSLILQMNDGTNTFVFHYVADATAATTAATDLALIGVFSGTTVQALTGDFI